MVRVAADKGERRIAWYSLLGAVAVAVLAVSALLLLRDPPIEAAPQRTLMSYPVRWTCEFNPAHEFTANGRYDPLPCTHPGCSGLCSIHQRYVCMQDHAAFDAWIQFDRVAETAGISEHIVRFRYAPTGPWRTSSDGRVPCPHADCRAETNPVNTAWSEHDLRMPRESPRPAEVLP